MSPLWLLLTLLPILGAAERFNCKGRILGAYYADAKSGCKAFHVCVRVAGGGIRDFRFFCPPGTLFHQEAQTCTDWGDDDPLACPADLYDGQFDLYRIGSGFDTKKLSSASNREEEPEFGLQRAETGDRRLSQNNAANGPANDLRAAHSSDFFSGQRDRGRDESAPNAPQPARPAAPSQHRQSFRRPTSQTAAPAAQYTTQASPQPTYQPQYDVSSKRKLVRKRPIYASTAAPSTTLGQNSPPQQQQLNREQNYESKKPQINDQQVNNNQQKYNQHFNQQQFNQPQQQQQLQQQFNQPQQQQQNQPQAQQPQQYNQPQQKHTQQQQQQLHNQQQPQHNHLQQQQQHAQPQQQHAQPQQHQPQPQQQQQPQNQQYNQPPQQNFNRRPSQQRQTQSTPNLPAQYKEYKDEYVEVSRVTPKQNRFYPSNTTPAPFTQSTSLQNYNKKDGLVELYNYDAQSTPGLNVQNENQPFKLRNSYNVADVPREPDFLRTRTQKNLNGNRGTPTTTVDYNTASRATDSSTPAYKNYNSVSYEPEKNNFIPFSKQNYVNNPTSTPTTTTFYTTIRSEPPQNLNTVAYNTNIGFHSQSSFSENEEDDGQYRPPQGEDDGQYRPELYDRELLSGAHSLNIAASGNRLPEDQKSYSKTKAPPKVISQTAAPRPFRPPTTTQVTYAPEQTYTTTGVPQTINTQRTFDYFQTYTTTSRPSDFPEFATISNAPRPTSTSAPVRPETRPIRPHTRPTAPPTFGTTPAPKSTRPPAVSNPARKTDDTSYDYAYYDSDPGFSEYDHIEEFGRTKKRA